MPPFIEIDDVSKSYVQEEKTTYALQNVSMVIEKGDIYGIIGLSGAGKSTLIRCLASLATPNAGRILFHGNDVSQLHGKSLRTFRKNIGMIFQHFNLLSSRTVEENIAYPLEIAQVPKDAQKKRIDELLGLVGLKDKKNAYPLQLSGGQKQRVGIARALANHPELLLCDEATSALDPKTTKEILDLLKTINQQLGITIVLITHEMEVIKRICHRVAVLDQGQVIEKGQIADVFADPKHDITKNFLQNSRHEIPSDFFKGLSANRRLLRLSFKGKSAKEPIISHLIKTYDVEANILSGWVDNLQTYIIGSLIIELAGSSENIQKALEYLEEKLVNYEELKP